MYKYKSIPLSIAKELDLFSSQSSPRNPKRVLDVPDQGLSLRSLASFHQKSFLMLRRRTGEARLYHHMKSFTFRGALTDFDYFVDSVTMFELSN
jgi:hypothetical protein